MLESARYGTHAYTEAPLVAGIGMILDSFIKITPELNIITIKAYAVTWGLGLAPITGKLLMSNELGIRLPSNDYVFTLPFFEKVSVIARLADFQSYKNPSHLIMRRIEIEHFMML